MISKKKRRDTQGDPLIERLLFSRKCILIAGLQWQPFKIEKLACFHPLLPRLCRIT